MTIDGITAKDFFLRLPFSVGVTTAIGVTALFCIGWLSGACQEAIPPKVETRLKAKSK
jgi:hypothetical protein